MPCINCSEQNINSLKVKTSDCKTLTLQSDMLTDLAAAEITQVTLLTTKKGTTTTTTINSSNLTLVDSVQSYQITSATEGIYEFTLLANYTACSNQVKETINYFNVCDSLKCKIINSIIDCPQTTISQTYDLLLNAQFCDGVNLTDLEKIYDQLTQNLENIEKNNPCTTC